MAARKFSNHVGEFSLTDGDFIAETLKRTGEWEPHFLEVLNTFTNKNSVCVDIGANFGYHSIAMAKRCKSVHAFEPMMEMYMSLKTHITFNKTHNCVPYLFALGDKSQKSSMCRVDPRNIGNTYIGEGGADCEIRTFDSFAIDPNFIKMDAQGFEEKILDGASISIKKNLPVIFFEVEEHHLVRYGSSSKKLLLKTMSYGYDIYRILNDYPSDHIAVPKGTVFDIKLKLQKIPPVFTLTFGKYGNLVYENII
jgi:FkbM family methyltransferase